MTELMLEAEGPNGFFAVFQEDEGVGYFFVYNPEKKRVLSSIRIYTSSSARTVRESDIELMWSSDQTKCGIVVCGQMRGIINIVTGEEACVPLQADPRGIVDSECLRGFEENYIDGYSFVRARQRYWKELGEEHLPGLNPLPENQTPAATNFIVYAIGPHEQASVFEDEGDTGYLYLYSPGREGTIVRHLHIYNRSEKNAVNREDVEVLWSEDGTKSAVAIWGKIRGVIDVANDRVWREGSDTSGVSETEWLKGFPTHAPS